MPDVLASMRQPFHERIRASRAWTWLTMRADRLGLAVALAALAPVLVLALAWLGPPVVQRTVTDPRHVVDVFSRFISAVATASAIAVSVITLVLGRELKGIRDHREHHDTNLEFRDRIRTAAGRRSLPLDLPGVLATALANVEDAVERVRDTADREVREATAAGVTLGDFLDTTQDVAKRVRVTVAETHRDASGLLAAAVEFDHEVALHLARRFGREEALPRRTRDALAELEARVADVVVGKWYTKTLDTEWGLSRMAATILAATIPSLAVASVTVLAYDAYVVDAWGVRGAAALVALALGVVIFPIAAFVAHLIRFVFVNRYTLPTSGFLLGPEEPDLVDAEREAHPDGFRARDA